MAAGLDSAILTHVPLRKRAAEKVAALLPFGWFGRGRGGGDAATGGWAAHVPMLSDQLSGGWGKLATAAAVRRRRRRRGGRRHPGRRAAAISRLPAADRPAAVERTGAAAQGRGERHRDPRHARDRGRRRRRRRSHARAIATPSGGARPRTPAAARQSRRPPASPPATAAAGAAPAAGGGGKGLPKVGLPTGGQNPLAPVQETVEDVVEPVQPVVDGVTDTVEDVVEPVQPVVDGVGRRRRGRHRPGILP